MDNLSKKLASNDKMLENINNRIDKASQGSDCLSVKYLQCVCARRSRFFTWWSLGVVKVLHILLEVYVLIETRQRSNAWALKMLSYLKSDGTVSPCGSFPYLAVVHRVCGTLH